MLVTISTTDIRNRVERIRSDYEASASVGEVVDNFIAQFVADYSDKFAFILELIQNAVDSAPDGCRVAINFDIRKDADGWVLVVSNNGLPFDIGDVERLCGMNKQRKGAGKIGYKGLGFKTVIGITDNPRVFSKTCKFEFNKAWHEEHEHLWVVIPHWIDDEHTPKYLPPVEQWVSFVLPLRTDVDIKELSQAIDNLANHNGMASLLFLRELESISVRNAYSDKSGNLRKVTDPVDPLICKLVRTPFGAKAEPEEVLGAWIVTHFPSKWKMGNPVAITDSAIKEYQQKRDSAPNCTAATLSSRPLISLAFRILSDGSGSVALVPKNGRVSAFFPVHRDDDSGLRFSVHADFLTTQNRERLVPNSAWNRWIFDNLPRAIASAVQEFKARREWVQFIYDAMPMEDEGRGEFNAVTKELCRLLRLAEIVLVDGNSPKQWYSPDRVIWPDTEALRALVEGTDGALFTQGKFLVSGVIKNNHENRERPRNFLCGKMGMRVEGLDRTCLLNLMTSGDWIGRKARDIDWLEKLFEYIADGSGITNTWISKMRGVPFLPTAVEGVLARMGEVFFPDPAAITPPATIVINERLARRPEVRHFLAKRLRVPEGPEAFVQSIISIAPRPSWDEIWVLKRYFSEVGESTALKAPVHDKLKNWMLLQASDGRFLPARDLHLPADINPGSERRSIVSVFVPEDDDRESWLRFFAWLGVRNYSEVASAPPEVPEKTLIALPQAGETGLDGSQQGAGQKTEPSAIGPDGLANVEGTPARDPTEVPIQVDVPKPPGDVIGHAGEQVAFDYVRDRLLERYSRLAPVLHQDSPDHFLITSADRRLAEGVWGNGSNEQHKSQPDWGEHYDFWVRIDDQDHYYEVKTTESGSDVTERNAGDQFKLTPAESAFAQEKGSCYHIARVYNVHAVREGHELTPDVVLVDDPSAMLAQSTLELVVKGCLEGAYTVRVKLIGMRNNHGESIGGGSV